MKFVRSVCKKRRLEIYKKVKGFCFHEGIPFAETMQNVLNEKAKDIEDILDYDMVNDYMDEYRICSYRKENNV